MSSDLKPLKQRPVLVGSGAVAMAMAQALPGKWRGVLARDPASAREVARVAQAPTWDGFAGPLFADQQSGADPVAFVIAVSDRAYEAVAEQLAGQLAESKVSGTWALMASGALPVKTLAPLAAVGCDLGRLHPLAPITPELAKRRSGGSLFDRVSFGVSGHGRALDAARFLVSELGGLELLLNEDPITLVRYHCSAAWLSNGLVGLVGAVEASLGQTVAAEGLGVDAAALRRGWVELLRRTLDELERLPADQALTGPVSRGDLNVLLEHWEQLESVDARRLYLELVRAQWRLVAKGHDSDLRARFEGQFAAWSRELHGGADSLPELDQDR